MTRVWRALVVAHVFHEVVLRRVEAEEADGAPAVGACPAVPIKHVELIQAIVVVLDLAEQLVEDCGLHLLIYRAPPHALARVVIALGRVAAGGLFYHNVLVRRRAACELPVPGATSETSRER